MQLNYKTMQLLTRYKFVFHKQNKKFEMVGL
jgi:hypothetical protein